VSVAPVEQTVTVTSRFAMNNGLREVRCRHPGRTDDVWIEVWASARNTQAPIVHCQIQDSC